MGTKFSGQFSITPIINHFVDCNKMVRENKFEFAEVSGLEGHLDTLRSGSVSASPNLIAVDDTSEGSTMLNNQPMRRVVKLVMISMRHAAGDSTARAECFEIMHEIFRQFMSAILMKKNEWSAKGVYLHPNIAFNEMDSYYFTGAACAWFQITFDIGTDMQFRADEWLNNPL